MKERVLAIWMTSVAVIATSCSDYQIVKKEQKKAAVVESVKKRPLKSDPQPKRKPRKTEEAIAAIPKPEGTPKVYGVDDSGALVSDAWMKEYLALAHKYGPSNDGHIEQWGESYKVNKTVRDHYVEMKLQEKKK